MQTLPYQIGQLLLRRGAISDSQLTQALALQAQETQPLGQALIKLGFIDEKTLKRVLREQKWLKPCAACFALVAPFSASWAAGTPADEQEVIQNWLDAGRWHQTTDTDYVNHQSAALDVAKFVALTAWDIYQGEPEAGEMRFNLSQTGKSGYQLEMTMHF